ncbi:hypothetical protein CK203_018085 [Vitis vinifera]|uniref:Retrotransposon gag domain-containing protein n=1 Tax=Vitis vinifera TaxID=29760 RepID=A0A438JVZ5_VITVI|nr:hypothetical protein CK203_018085 [Vitis vinifera]
MLMMIYLIHLRLYLLASLVERQARATGNPTETEAWIMKIEKLFDVIDCSEEQKASYATFMLDKEADHWWCMTKRLLEYQRSIVWSQFKEAFYKKYFLDSVLTTKEVVDRALIAEKDNEEFHQYREQQRKRNRNDGAHGNQAQEKGIWFGIVQRVGSLYLGSLRRRIKRIDRNPGLKGGMPIDNMNFDLFVATPLGDFVVLHTMHMLIVFGKRVTFSIPGCQGFLAYVVNKENDLKLEDIPIVRDYPNVFPDDLPGLPPKREVEFTIDVAPGTTPISKAPYRMAPMEFKELKIQL